MFFISFTKTFFSFLAVAVIFSFCSLFLAFFGAQLVLQPSLPQNLNLSPQAKTPLRIYSRDQHLMAIYGTEKRTIENHDEFPQQLIHAFLSAEDSRFFEHKGVDFKSLTRAIYSFTNREQRTTGGSTITMQLAKLQFLTNKKTILRKLKQIYLALIIV